MPMLCIDLQEGFRGVPIAIALNGRSIYGNRPRTQNQIGLAERLTLDCPDFQVRLVIEDLQTGQKAEREVASGQDIHVGVNREEDGTFVFSVSKEPFNYL